MSSQRYDALVTEAELLTDRERRAWYGFLTMQEDLRRHLNRELMRDSAISLSEFAVLSTLQMSDQDAMRVHEMRAVLRWEKTRLTHQISRMSSRELVRRITSDEDPRGVRIALTDKGRATIEAAVPGHVAQVRRFFFDAVAPKHLDVIANVSESVLEGLEEDGVDDATS
jgi:DNA-binding MarR family transcriptional regulator